MGMIRYALRSDTLRVKERSQDHMEEGMIVYTLYGTARCPDCMKAKELMRGLDMSYEYVDVGNSDSLVDFNLLLNDLDGDGMRIPGLLACEPVEDNGEPELLRRLWQGNALLKYLHGKKSFKEKNK